ncbi:putative copper resistance protein D [Micromonospora pallida]|uniref:Putative copper resistance protein D n=1 Tax=Micromonospora pallida TaxID=145854 RepID=A0A1C6RJ62_9ACTN|nr:cytochrome c oxidase assembly protein [Micromonospora pallida]SCL17082.1 putative copper resistance protein D [Micromonospora pallida]
MTRVEQRPVDPPVAARRGVPVPVLVAATVAVAAVVLAGALRYGGGTDREQILGLPDGGAVTAWGLPVARALSYLGAVLTVGWTVAAAFLLPGLDRLVGPTGYRLLRRASWSAALWLVATVVALPLTASSLLGQPADQVTTVTVLSLAMSVSQGQGLVVAAAMIAMVLAATRWAITRTGVAVTALLAVAATLPPVLTGHSAGSGNHAIAVSSVGIHTAATALWVGGLAALLTLPGTRDLPRAARRYSTLALWCFVLMGLSGVANTVLRLYRPDELWSTRYGALVLVKAVVLVALGGFGAAHRSRTLPRLAVDGARAFRRLAAIEVLVFAGIVAVGVAMSRSPAPVTVDPAEPDVYTELLGFPLPAAPTVARLLGQPVPDAYFLLVAVIGGGLYLAGVRRLRQAGRAWPAARTVSLLAGMLVLVAVTCLGFARYAAVTHAHHIGQHLALLVLVPLLVSGGAPGALAGAVLRSGPTPDLPGAREWWETLRRSGPARGLGHPVTAVVALVACLYLPYVAPVLSWLMQRHVGHLGMLTAFLFAGGAVATVLRHRPRRVVAAVLAVTTAALVLFAVLVRRSDRLRSADWFDLVRPDWAPTPAADHKQAAWTALAGAVVLAVAGLVRLTRTAPEPAGDVEGPAPANRDEQPTPANGDESAVTTGERPG